MLKDKRLLTGLGIGLIIGAILLELMNVALTGVNQGNLNSDSIFNENEYTIEELKEIADSLDYNIIEKSVVHYTQDELDEAIIQAKQAAATVPDVDDSDIEVPAVEPVQEVTTTLYRITIQKGMVTDSVSRLLLNTGLIDDEIAFKEQLESRKLTNSIQVGDFEFTSKPSLAELINKITSRS